jgi:hypothetical protein
VIASDITDKSLLISPRDAKHFGVDPTVRHLTERRDW